MAGFTVTRRGISSSRSFGREATYPGTLPAPSGSAATDTANLLAAATGSAGRLVAWPGAYQLNGRVTVPNGMNLAGAGNAQGGSTPATQFLCTTAGAGLTFLGSGGRSSDFTVDGQGVATQPLIRGDNTGGTGRTFLSVGARNGQDNLTVLYSQNDTWICPILYAATRDNLVLDAGCGGLTFINLEANAHGRYGIHSQATILTGPYIAPTQVNFIGGRSETGTSAVGGSLQVDDGAQWSFERFDFNHSAALATAAIANVKSTGGRTSSDISFRDCYWSCAGANTQGLHVDNGSYVTMDGGLFNTQGGAIDLAAGANLYMVRAPAAFGIPLFTAATPASAIVGVFPPGNTDLAWAALTPQNSWVNVGVPFPNIGYRKDGQGFVALRGLIGSGVQTAGTLLATLPVAYRPGANRLFTCPVNNTGGTATIQVASTGAITLQGVTGAVSWIDLGGCAPFLAEN